MTDPSRPAALCRPCASRTVKRAEHVAPGASLAQLATMREAEATANVTPTHVLVGVTDTTCSGVPGSGLTSPEAPTTSTAHDEPEA